MSINAPVLASLLAFTLLTQNGQAADSGSSLVYAGPDGRLVYAGYANEGQTSTGNRMIDFSYAGYQGGGVAIPWVPVEVVLDPIPGGGDDHARIQAAIDTLSAMPLSPAGFRGTLLLRAGTYRVSETLHVNASGIVIRGEGQSTGGTVVQFTATQQDDLIEFAGSSGWSRIAGTELAITDALVPSGTRSFQVASSGGFAVGDRLMVHRTPNQAWIDLLEMGQWGWTPAAYACETPRRITAIDGNTITVDAPLVHAIESQYGGGEVYRYHFDGAIRQVGIERIRLESSYAGPEDEDHGWSAVKMRRVENAWARQVTAKYFGYACVDVRDESQFVTVEDCAQLDPKSQITGSRRYSFRIDDSSFILFQRCYTEEGRHDYVTQSNTAGPNVFVDSLAERVHSDIGPHHRYSQGILFDNIKGGPINVQNREDSGTGHGWSGSQIVFWNCEASTLICDTPKAAMNFAIGCVGTKREGQWAPGEPDGFWESHQVPVTPRSLYYMQLRDRLGGLALDTVTTAAQRRGRVWSELSSWNGNAEAPSLPAFSPLQVDLGDDLTIPTLDLELSAVVRYPLPANFPLTVGGWTQVGGPGPVSFGDPMVATTTVSFPGPGTYELAFAISQDDDRAPGNVVTYQGSDSLLITVPVPPDGIATLVSADSILGEGQANAPALNYYPDADDRTVGTGGSTVTQTRTDRNVVLGFALPILPEGESIDSVDFHFEIEGARDQTGAANLPDLDVHLLDIVNPDITGTDFFFHGSDDSSPAAVAVGTTSVTISGSAQNNFADDAEDRSFTLTGESLDLFRSFYGGDHLPDRSEVFFRFSLSEDPVLGELRRYAIDVDSDESRVEIFSSEVLEDYATWIAGFEVGALDGLDDDPDADGIGNGLESFFGTRPDEPSTGVVPVSATASSVTFIHPQGVPATDLEAAYRWSTDLVSFHADGSTVGGTTVDFAVEPDTSLPGQTRVTATASGDPIERMFVRIEVTQSTLEP